MISLVTLGRVDLRSDTGDEIRAVIVQPKRLAILLYLLLARPRGFHRRKSLLPLFWPELTDKRARHALRQSLHFLRQSVGREVIATRGGEEVGVAIDLVRCDVIDFEGFVSAGEWEQAVRVYNGPMLKGVNVTHSPGFQTWLDAERRRLGDLYVRALDGMLQATQEGAGPAVETLRKLAEHDPHDPDITLRLMRALEASHDRPGALHQARAYSALVSQERGQKPDPRVAALADRLAGGAQEAVGRVEPDHDSDRPQGDNRSRGRQTKSGSWIPKVLTFAALLAIVVLAVLRRSPVATGERPVDDTRAEKTTIVIAPFTSLSDSAGEYLAAGVTNGVMNRLASVAALRVIRWEADEGLGVASVSDGEGNAVRKTLVLRASVKRDREDADTIHVQVGASVRRDHEDIVVWRESFRRSYDDVAMIERDIAVEIISHFAIPTSVSERESLHTLSTENGRAYDEYLRGIAALDIAGRIARVWTAFGPRVDFPQAVAHFESAVALDTSFVLPLARLSIANTSMFHWRYDWSQARLDRAKEAMDRAIQLRADLQPIHLAAAWYYYLGQSNYDRALRHLQMAQSAWAGRAEAILLTGAIRRRQGEVRQAIEEYRAAEKESGICPDCQAEMAYSYYILGDVPHANEAAARALAIAPDLQLPRRVAALIQLTEFGDVEAADRQLDPQPIEPGDVLPLVTSRWGVLVRVLGGRWEDALDALTLDRVNYDTSGYYLARADLAERRKDSLTARAYYDSARVTIEGMLDRAEDNAFVHSDLGLAYAGLGKKADAIREGTAAVRLRSPSADLFDGPLFIEALANIYMKLGEHDAAVKLLEDVVELKCWLTPELIRLDPRWAPLHAHPRFRRLIGRGRPT